MTPPRIAAVMLALLAARSIAAQPPRLLPRLDEAKPLETTAETSANVSAGDLDGDGDLDIVLAKGRHWPLLNLVLLNDGKGGFDEPYPVSAEPDRTYTAALADLDGDGDLDLVVGNDSPDPKRIHLNDGKGRFSSGGTSGEPGWNTRNITVADVNGDERPDIVVANRGSRGPTANYVCLNDGAGRFPACASLSTDSATTIAVSDLDGDAKPDIVIPHRDGGQSYVYAGDGRGGFAPGVAFGAEVSATRAVALGNVTGDGRPDIIVGDEKGGGGLLFVNEGGMAFASPIVIADPSDVFYSIEVADLNDDGRNDVIIGNDETRSLVLVNEGDLRFEPIRFGDETGAVYGLDIADVNGDGVDDVLAARSGSPNTLYLNRLVEASAPGAGLTRSSDALERRDRPVSEEDLRILTRAQELLSDESAWNRDDDRKCEDDEASGRRSLFCALHRASLDVIGSYDHRRVALQEVRFAIEDASAGRRFEHRLRDFNNLPENDLDAIKSVLRAAAERVRARLP